MLIVDTINDALIELGVLNPNDEATPQDHEYGLRTLNRIIDQYNAQGIMVTYLQDMAFTAPHILNECNYTPAEYQASPTKWNSSITIGNCKDINTTAPIDIRELFWRLDNTDYNSKEMTANDYASISYKNVEGIPRRHYIRKLEDNSIEINFDYIPITDLELHLMALKPYTGVNDNGNNFAPTDDINWSFGFEKMLMTRLALELAPSYETNPSQILISKAAEAEDILKRKNIELSTLKRRAGYGKKTRLDNLARY